MEEYYDYVFPEEAGAAPNLKLLEAAYRWKRQKTDGAGVDAAAATAAATTAAAADDDDDDDNEDE